MSTSIEKAEEGSVAPGGARPPATAIVPTLGVAVIAVESGAPVGDIEPWEATRVSLIAAVDAVGASRTVLVGPIELHDLAVEFSVGFAESDGTWDDGVRRALSIAPAELIALTPHDAVVVESRLREVASTLGVFDGWIAADVWGGARGPRGDSRLAPGCLVRTSITSRAMRGGDSASAAWRMRADGWSCRVAAGSVMAAQGDVPPALAQRQAVLAGSAVLRSLLRRTSPLREATCPRAVRWAAARESVRHVAGLVTALFVACVSVAVARGWLPPVAPVPAVAVIAAAAAVSVWGAASVDTSIRTVARAVAGGVASHAERYRIRIGRPALFDRPFAASLTLALEVSLVYRAGVLQLAPVRTEAEHRADLVALAVGAAVLVPLLVSLRVIVRARPRRSSTRVPVALLVRLDGRPGTTTDIGARGFGVRLDEAPNPGGRVAAVFREAGGDLYVPAVVVRVEPAPNDGAPGRFLVGLRAVVSPSTDGTLAFQRMWLRHAADVVRERSPWQLTEHVTSRQATAPIRVSTAVTAVVLTLAYAPPYPVSASAAPTSLPGTRSALPFAAGPETGAPGRATPDGMIHH